MKESAPEQNIDERTAPAIAAGVHAGRASGALGVHTRGDCAARESTEPFRETYTATRLAVVSFVESEPRVLLTGVDTLDVGLYVEFTGRWRTIVERLSRLKRQAQTQKAVILGEGRCLMLPGGKPNYPFHLQYPGYQLYLSRKATPDGDTPNVFVSLNSECLWQHGVDQAVNAVGAELAEIAPSNVREQRISRCDLCADLLLPAGLTVDFINRHLVCRTHKQHAYTNGDRLETIYLGAAGSDVLLRVYDKSLEIESSGKRWFLPLWGIAVNSCVWRFEFQLRRDFLRSVGVNSLDDLRQKAGELWRYLTEDWCSLRQLNDENASRRSLIPLWQTIQACAARFGPALSSLNRTPRPPSVDPRANLKSLASNFVGFAARNHLTSLDETLFAVGQALREEFQEREFLAECQRKAIQLGLDLTREAA